MIPKTPSLPDAYHTALPVEELRAQIWAAKEKRRAHLANLPILEKFRIMEQMKEAADPIRAYRKLTAAHDQR
jgi:hypothetical protein